MLAKRIIPCLDVNCGRVVKGIKFTNLKDAGDPVVLAKYYNSKGADELVFLDITASFEKRKIVNEMVKKVAREIFIPFTVGGGVSTLDDIKNTLLSGADKVSINTAAVKNPELITKVAKIFGSQCIVVAIDARKKDESWEVVINGGKTPTGLDAVSWSKETAERGAGEILLTSMDCDGTKSGYDMSLTKTVSDAVNIPVIASGGAGSLNDIAEVFEKGNADAALVASLFHFGELKIKNLKKYLKKKNIPVRY